jgi:hypothetical protein
MESRNVLNTVAQRRENRSTSSLLRFWQKAMTTGSNLKNHHKFFVYTKYVQMI